MPFIKNNFIREILFHVALLSAIDSSIFVIVSPIYFDHTFSMISTCGVAAAPQDVSGALLPAYIEP
jgi:hypothetical protein